MLLIRWQIDSIGPLPVPEGYGYAMTCVDKDTVLVVAFPTGCADQETSERGLGLLSDAYGRPQVIESDQVTHFPGHTL